MGLLDEFKKFALRGNIVDLATGVIIGGAFGKITASLVNDVVMPPIGLLLGGTNFNNLAITLKAAEGEAPAVMLKYGAFAQTVIDFLLVAWAVFVMLKAYNKLITLREKKEAEAAVSAPAPPPAPTKDQELLSEIRDLLKAGR